MNVKRRIKLYWGRYFSRPFRTASSAFLQFYGRVVIFLHVRKIKMPFQSLFIDKLAPDALALVNRRTLVHQIRQQRYRFSHGPLWMRQSGDSLLLILSRNRIWIVAIAKIFLGFILVTLPIFIFSIVRGTLPVPERILRKNHDIEFQSKSSLKSEWLYTEPPYSKQRAHPNQNQNLVAGSLFRGASVIPVSDEMAPPGLMHFGIGYYPRKTELLRGFLVSEKAPLTIYKQRPIRIDIAGRNRFRARTYLFPAPGEPVNCHIEMRDEQNNLLLATDSMTPLPRRIPNDWLSKTLSERLTPADDFFTGRINDFSLNTDNPPEELRVFTWPVGTEPATFSPGKKQLDNDSCVLAVNDFSFQWEQVRPLARRGALFIMVDTLRADTAYNPLLMPKLNEFMQSSAMRFNEHRAQGNMTIPSITSFLTSQYARDLGVTAFSYSLPEPLKKAFYQKQIPTLPNTLRRMGYRVGAIGNISLFTEALEGGVDFGFHDGIVLESPQYETRHITEEALSWIENNGDAPFFLYLHYHTMHGPYRPPLKELSLSRYLAHPFGIQGEQELYNGLSRYFDDEFGYLLNSLADMGLKNNIDIYVSADHGAQLKVQPYRYFSGINSNLMAATRDKGFSLFDEEVRVPLAISLAHQDNLNGTIIKIPSAHVDLFPSIAHWMGRNEDRLKLNLSDTPVRGLTLFNKPKTLNKDSIQEVLNTRNSIYFDGYRHAGILIRNSENSNYGLKYVRQFDPQIATLFLDQWPWSVRSKWFEPEQFARVNFKDGTEEWLPTISQAELMQARNAYFEASPTTKNLNVSAVYKTNVDFEIEIKNKKGRKFAIESIPDNLNHSVSFLSQGERHRFTGNMLAGERISVSLGDSTVENLIFSSKNILVACPSAQKFQPHFLVQNLASRTCIYQPPSIEFLTKNYTESDNVLSFSASLGADTSAQFEMRGAGEALAQALKDWGYAK